jgi:5-aminopentanamidase
MSPQGKIEGKYSKVHLQNWMTASGVHNGSAFPVFEIRVGGESVRVGIIICYDIQHPESVRELALGGAEVVFVPYCTDDFSRPLLIHLFETRALENRVYLVRVNYARPRNSGTSSVIDFEGATLEQLGAEPDIIVRDLDLEALRKSRLDWDNVYGSRYRQPKTYQRIPQTDVKERSQP